MRHYLLLLPLLFLLINAPVRAQDESAYLRVGNYSPDAPALDLFLDGQRTSLPSLRPGEISGWLATTPGQHQIAFVASGNAGGEPLVGPVNLNLEPGSFSSLLILGTDDNIYAIWVIDQRPEMPPAGSARITAFNGIPGSLPIDIFKADGTPVWSDIGFGRAASFTLPVGEYNLRLRERGMTEGGLRTGNTPLSDGGHYILGAIPSRNGNGVLLLPIAPAAALLPEQLAAMPQAQPTAAPTGPPPTPAAQAPGTLAGGEEAGDIVSLIASEPQLAVMTRALAATGVGASLRQADNVTVFVPTDAAWRNLLTEYPDLLPDTEAIRNVLLYHIVEDRVPTEYIFDQMDLLTMQGSPLRFVKQGDSIAVNNRARLIATDVMASNGIIHVVDAVLVPPDMLPGGEASIVPQG